MMLQTDSSLSVIAMSGKALKEMMVVNVHLNDQLERIVKDWPGVGRRTPDSERIGRPLSFI